VIRRRPAKTYILAFFLALSLGAPGTALGQDPSPEDRETARSLLIEGRAKMQAKDFPGALRSLKAAHLIMKVPTTGLDYASALEANGMLVEARTVALDVKLMPEKPGEPEAFKNARVQAAEIATKLEARIPSVVVTVKGLAAGVQPTVMIDDAKLLAAAVGLPRKVNPGAHVIKVTAQGYLTVEKKVELKEGASNSLPVEAAMAVDPNAPKDAPPPQPQQQQQQQQQEPQPPPGPQPVPGWAWGMLAVGVVGVGVGAGFTADYVSVKNKVSADCPNNACMPTNFKAANALSGQWNRDLALMGVGFGVGLVGLVTAIGGIASAKSAPAAPAKTGFAPWFSPGAGGVAVTGAF
jgi:hypothetical protein